MLHYAVRSGHALLVAELIRSGVCIDARNSLGETALHLAVYSGRLLVTEQLIDKGANIDATNNDNETPLFYAARKNLSAVVRLLLQRNARTDIRDKYGDLAVEHATEKRTIQCFEVVQSKSTGCEEENEMVSHVSSSSSSSRGMPTWYSYELLLRTIKFLGPKDVCRAACVAGKWHRVCESEEVWSALGIRRWEVALNSSLGFNPPAAASFLTRPLSSQSRNLKGVGRDKSKKTLDGCTQKLPIDPPPKSFKILSSQSMQHL